MQEMFAETSAPAPGPVDDNPFVLDYLFPDLQQDPDEPLLEPSAMVSCLTRLGLTMHDEDAEVRGSRIPAAYVYFGQFVDHDIFNLLGPRHLEIDFSNPQLAPLALEEALGFTNFRHPPLDLDSVYKTTAVDGVSMRLGQLTASGSRPPGTAEDPFQDLPRQNRVAWIGDSRNDENLIIAQLLVAFLRAHNRLVEEEHLPLNEARRKLREHYQWIILDDFLPRIADPQIVASTLREPRFYGLPGQQFFLPLEFVMAAYRFGHSMVGKVYDYNANFPRATLGELFTLTSRGGLRLPTGESFETLPESWIIQWGNFVGDRPSNAARPIDTRLVEPLFAFPDMKPHDRLAVRDLLHGYRFRMPTGQALARAMGIHPLSQGEIEESAASREQAEVLWETGFSSRTPLWFYILAEAAHGRRTQGTDHLGPVGSTLVAETLIGLIRREFPDLPSILSQPDWRPSLGREPGRFKLPDLLHYAGVLL